MSIKPLPTNRRYPRGEETKLRIICSAIETFGRQGYAGTSTRDVSAAANVNTPAISYYFGNKLGLYQACIDRLTARVQTKIADALQACRADVAAGAPLETIIASLGEVQSCLIDSFFTDDEGAAIRRLLAWEDAEHGENMSDSYMKDRIGLPVFETFRGVVEHVVATPLPRTEIEMHAMALMGITMIFHLNQSRVMDMLRWPTLDDGLLATLKVVAHRQLAHALTGLSRPCDTPVEG